MIDFELAAKRAWLKYAVDVRFGSCETCGRVRDENGKPLLVARQNSRRRRYECLVCWDQHEAVQEAR